LVTGADISASGEEVVLVGYRKKFSVFLWVLNEFGSNGILSGSRKRFKLGKVTRLGQMEAVGFTENALYFSNEKIPFVPARLYRLNAAIFNR